jgi:hypothetical protein
MKITKVTKVWGIAGVFASGVAAAGCSGPPPEPPSASVPQLHGLAIQAASAAAAPYKAFLLTRSSRSHSDLSNSGAALAGLLYGTSAPQAPFQSALTAAAPNVGGIDVDVGWQAGLQFSYRADNDRRLVMNANVTSDMGSTQDIGEAAAQAIFASTFQSAVSSGAISATGLNQSDVRNTKIVQGEGAMGQAPVERTSEYVFTVPRKINGVEVFDAGFQVSVHRTGQTARVSAFGPTVASTLDATGSEVPAANGYSFSRSVSQTDLDSRAAAEHPGADIQSIGVRYWLPYGVTSAAVEPRQLYFVVPTATISGEKVLARGFYVAYSLSRAGQAPTVGPQAEQNPSGDGKK